MAIKCLTGTLNNNLKQPLSKICQVLKYSIISLIFNSIEPNMKLKYLYMKIMLTKIQTFYIFLNWHSQSQLNPETTKQITVKPVSKYLLCIPDTQPSTVPLQVTAIATHDRTKYRTGIANTIAIWYPHIRLYEVWTISNIIMAISTGAITIKGNWTVSVPVKTEDSSRIY